MKNLNAANFKTYLLSTTSQLKPILIMWIQSLWSIHYFGRPWEILQCTQFIRPSSIPTYFHFGLWDLLDPILVLLGEWQWYSLDRFPVHCRVHLIYTNLYINFYSQAYIPDSVTGEILAFHTNITQGVYCLHSKWSVQWEEPIAMFSYSNQCETN